MKNLVIALFAVVAFSFAASAQNADNALIGKAKGVAHECLQNKPAGWEVSASIETVGICFVEGFIQRVTFYAEYKCHAENCPKVAARLLATVDFDCEGNVISYNCY